MTRKDQTVEWTKPSWGPIWLSCRNCGHTWDDWQPQMVPVETWIAHCKTYHCPNCGQAGRNVCGRVKPLVEGGSDAKGSDG